MGRVIGATQLIAGLVSAAAVTALFAVSPEGQAPGYGPPARGGGDVVDPALQLAGSSCGDVLFLGAMGSGQRPDWDKTNGFGTQVNAMRKALVDALPQRRVSAVPVDYPARGVEYLIPDKEDVRRGLKHYTDGTGRYFEGLDRGTDTAFDVLVRRDRSCGEERIVLAGYSQGAMLMHRVLNRLVAHGQKPIMRRIAGVVLIADGDRVPQTGAAEIIGNEAAPRSGEGIASAFGNRPDIPRRFDAYTYNFCTKRDIVCDFRARHHLDPWNGKVGASIHTTDYIGKRYAPTVAPKIARVVMSWPLPKPRHQTITLTAGQPVSVQLKVSVRADFRDRVTWTTTSPLPPGLRLTSRGYLSGIPTSNAPMRTTYTVRAADGGIFGTPTTGTLSWAVDGAPVSGNAPQWLSGLTVDTTYNNGTWSASPRGSFRDTNAKGTVGYIQVGQWPPGTPKAGQWEVHTASTWAGHNAARIEGNDVYDAYFGTTSDMNPDGVRCVGLVDVWDDWGGPHSPFSEAACFTADGQLLPPQNVNWEAAYQSVADLR